MKKVKEFFGKLFAGIKEGFNKIFKGYVYSNVGEYKKKIRSMPKKEIIKELLKVAGALNDNPGQVKKEFLDHLKSHGKRQLERALVVMKVALTQKLNGKTEKKKKK